MFVFFPFYLSFSGKALYDLAWTPLVNKSLTASQMPPSFSSFTKWEKIRKKKHSLCKLCWRTSIRGSCLVCSPGDHSSSLGTRMQEKPCTHTHARSHFLGSTELALESWIPITEAIWDLSLMCLSLSLSPSLSLFPLPEPANSVWLQQISSENTARGDNIQSLVK